DLDRLLDAEFFGFLDVVVAQTQRHRGPGLTEDGEDREVFHEAVADLTGVTAVAEGDLDTILILLGDSVDLVDALFSEADLDVLGKLLELLVEGAIHIDRVAQQQTTLKVEAQRQRV